MDGAWGPGDWSHTGPGPGTPDEAPGRRSVRVAPFPPALRAQARAAFTLRRVSPDAWRTIISGAVRPRSGDLVVARVDRIGYQSRIELQNGRKAHLHPGSIIVVAYGDRYATDQFEAEVPDSLKPTSLVASGGVAADVLSRTAGIKPATSITPLGLVGDDHGRPLNVAHFALRPIRPTRPRPRTIAVLGTAMNSGKTTSNRYLAMGLAAAGAKVGAAKLTGTGSGNDFWAMADAGVMRMVDFVDAGMSSTYRIPLERIEQGSKVLIDHLTEAGCDVILLEIADGVFQSQNIALLRSEFFLRHVDSVLFAAGEALGAARGLEEMRYIRARVLGVTGLLTASKLMIGEVRNVCNAPVFTRDELADPAIAARLAGLPTDDIDPPFPTGPLSPNSLDPFS